MLINLIDTDIIYHFFNTCMHISVILWNRVTNLEWQNDVTSCRMMSLRNCYTGILFFCNDKIEVDLKDRNLNLNNIQNKTKFLNSFFSKK